MTPREAVLEDVITRLAEDYGIEVLSLDWTILEQLHEQTEIELAPAKAGESDE